MIPLDTSVMLAHLMAEDRSPPGSLRREALASSRLPEVETWNRLHARGLADSRDEYALALIAEIGMLDLVQPVISRPLEPFPSPALSS